ncbi:hypothetical protein MKX03_002559 [Papaver bracteatum]|nr:hypothetical protein MKX03_002559 [Papaver bracteatum]
MDSFLFGNTLNNLNESGFFEISSGSPTASDVGNSLNNLDELPWDLYGDQWNLIHLASEYGHLEIVKVLLISTTNGGMNPCVRLDIDAKSPLDYAAMKGREDVIDVLLDALPLSATASYLLMEADPMPSEDVPTHDVFEALNQKLLLTIQQQYFLVENFLASDPLLFRALCSRSCPLLTQLYFCVLTRQTDDLMEELNKMSYEFEPAKRQEHIYPYPLHDVSTWGYIHMVELILIYGSGLSSVCLLKDTDGETPLHCAAQTGRVSVINMLLSTCWECAGMVSDKRNETALHCALRNNQTKAFKALLEWYIIKEEFLNNNARDWECGPCGDTPLELLVEGYAKIVKELLCQSGSKICFQKEFWKGKEYFVVIKCKKMESFGNSFEYGDYIREVTSRATNRTILSLSVDSRSIITLKVLIRSVMVRGILDVRDVDNNTVFDLLDETKEVRKTNLMGFVPYQRYENVIWLLDAIQMGDYQAFSKLQAEDPHILDYVCELPLGGTPLHIAVRFGQLNDCTREIIRKRPEFAETRDHKERNPLHIAAAKGYFEIVKELVTQVGFSQCFASDYVEGADTMDWGGEFYGTPLDYAIKNGRTSVVSELLPIWWKCGGVLREGNSKLLRLAVAFKQFEALKMLMERYIEDELLKAKEVDGNPMSALADGYIEIVLKHLLCPKVDYSLSILVKNRDAGKKKGTKHPLSLYFAVIKVTSTGSRRKDNNIVDQMLLSAYYPKYFREVTVQNKIVLHLSVDQENSVTLKLLLRSPLFYQLDYTYGHDFFCNVFDSLLDDLENEVRN